MRDGRIYGPGAGDMKGADAILMELFRSLHTTHPGISVGLLLTSDEERGGTDGVPRLIDEHQFRCGLAIIPDGGSLNDITVEEKGVLQIRIVQHGHEAHGARPWSGTNAVELLLDRLTALRRHFAQYWPEGDVVEQQNHWFPTCAVTILKTPNETPNRIPAEAEAVVDIRFPPPHTVESMQAEVSRALGCGCEIEPVMAAETTHLDPDPVFCEVAAEITGRPVRRVRASGASDSRFFRQHGIPVNLSRPFVGNLHAVDEWIDIASMVTYYQICDTYIHRKLRLV
ncbi:MAG: M20 family metallopeptidase [Planctomycetaceae bacterium]